MRPLLDIRNDLREAEITVARLRRELAVAERESQREFRTAWEAFKKAIRKERQEIVEPPYPFGRVPFI